MMSTRCITSTPPFLRGGTITAPTQKEDDMTERVDLSKGRHETKYMVFQRIPFSGKTQKWTVSNKSGVYLLGDVFYYPGWRQYIFRPCEGTEYNNTCLTEITAVLTALNQSLEANR